MDVRGIWSSSLSEFPSILEYEMAFAGFSLTMGQESCYSLI
jgi:hypothetical protein